MCHCFVTYFMLTLAQMALEEYIKQVKETWTNYTLDLVNYQNKCRLIRCDSPAISLATCRSCRASEAGMSSLPSAARI